MVAIMLLFFFFNDPATTQIYTLSLHDALPISSLSFQADSFSPSAPVGFLNVEPPVFSRIGCEASRRAVISFRSEEHTSELQSQSNLVCRLLLEKKNTMTPHSTTSSDSSY